MHLDDLILVSVDDHLVEPADLFETHLADEVARTARPKIVHTDDGSDVWVFGDAVVPNVGLNAVAGRPKEEYGVDPTAWDEMRPGCYDVDERVKDMNAAGVLELDELPEPSRVLRSPLRGRPRQGPRARARPRATTTGTSTSGAARTPTASSRWRCRCCGTSSSRSRRSSGSRRRAATR